MAGRAALAVRVRTPAAYRACRIRITDYG